MPITHRKFLLVGHCGADAGLLTTFIHENTDGVAVTPVNDEAAMIAAVRPNSLLLINRVLEGGFGTTSGQELIERTLARPNAPAVMLISNHADAQAAATAAGALPGFGKGELSSDEARRKLRDATSGAPAA